MSGSLDARRPGVPSEWEFRVRPMAGEISGARDAREGVQAGDEPIAQMRLYREWLQRERGLSFADYAAMWRWSTTCLADFWRSIWDYDQLQSPTPFSFVVGDQPMPGVPWFGGAQVNYAHQ